MKTAILIISYKRPECRTVKTILDAGYTGEWYIVADDTDETDYESLYPGHVSRFGKEEYYQKTDTVDNFHEMRVSVYARNYCWDFAKEHGFDVFGLFDDDITGFMFRYLKEGRFLGKKVTDFQAVFEAYCKAVYDGGIAASGFVSGGGLIGGGQSPVVQKGYYDNPTNTYLINTHVEPHGQYPFMSTIWEDTLYSYVNNSTGRITLAYMPIVANMISPFAMKPGGCTEIYKEQGKYIHENYFNIVIPSFFHWNVNFDGHVLSHKFPKIINEQWRKQRER